MPSTQLHPDISTVIAADNVRRYWQQQGYKVKVRIEPETFALRPNSKYTQRIWCIKSNLRNGRPVRSTTNRKGTAR